MNPQFSVDPLQHIQFVISYTISRASVYTDAVMAVCNTMMKLIGFLYSVIFMRESHGEQYILNFRTLVA